MTVTLIDDGVTGQVEFDSHTSDVIGYAITLINNVTPGQRHGREMPAPVGDDLDAAVHAALPSSDAPPHPGPDDAKALAGWATRLREVIELVDAADLDTACTRLNAIMADSRAVPHLSHHDGEPWHLHFHGPEADWATSWAAPMATGLAIVLGNPAVDRLGVCRAPACDRVYIDVSRNGTRQFCSTACQNRVKAAAFRARRTES
jgi:predicted RNA-binding Zn ribbon-like protein